MLTSVLDVVSYTPQPLYPRKKSLGIHWIGGWVGPRAGLERSRIEPQFLGLTARNLASDYAKEDMVRSSSCDAALQRHGQEIWVKGTEPLACKAAETSIKLLTGHVALNLASFPQIHFQQFHFRFHFRFQQLVSPPRHGAG
jgi:hypothetical protein